jgi:hypothetical protein
MAAVAEAIRKAWPGAAPAVGRRQPPIEFHEFERKVDPIVFASAPPGPGEA